jgi:hypothetical protein
MAFPDPPVLYSPTAAAASGRTGSENPIRGKDRICSVHGIFDNYPGCLTEIIINIRMSIIGSTS